MRAHKKMRAISLAAADATFRWAAYTIGTVHLSCAATAALLLLSTANAVPSLLRMRV